MISTDFNDCFQRRSSRRIDKTVYASESDNPVVKRRFQRENGNGFVRPRDPRFLIRATVARANRCVTNRTA